MPADDELDPLDRWLNQQVRPLPPPSGTFELITKRARRRKIRKAVVSVACRRVAAAVGFAVPVGMSLHLSTSDERGPGGGGSTQPSSNSTRQRSGRPARSRAAASSAASASASGASGVTTPGYLPPNFQPYSVTWDSLTTGWIMGRREHPATAALSRIPAICTSVARTDDGGQTWHGLPAPPVGGPMAATGVTGMRFLNGKNGWAFGPELWATDDGGDNWHPVNTRGNVGHRPGDGQRPGLRVVRALAARAREHHRQLHPIHVENRHGGQRHVDTSRRDPGQPHRQTGGLSGRSQRGDRTGKPGRAATGYLAAPDGTLYAGPWTAPPGTRWRNCPAVRERRPATDCQRTCCYRPPGRRPPAGRAWRSCARSAWRGRHLVVYLSTDNGSTWAQVNAGTTPAIGAPQSLTALPNGTLILATESNTSSPGGIYFSPSARRSGRRPPCRILRRRRTDSRTWA